MNTPLVGVALLAALAAGDEPLPAEATRPVVTNTVPAVMPAHRTPAEIAAELARAPARFAVQLVPSVAGEDVLGSLWPKRGQEFDEPFVITDGAGEKRLADRSYSEGAQEVLGKAEALFRAERYAEAAKLYEEAAAKDPGCFDCWSFAGDCYYFRDLLAEALERYAKAITIHRMGHRAYFYAGKTLLQGGHREDGVEMLRIALTLRPDWKTLLDAVAVSAKALQLELPPQPVLRPPGLLREEPGKVTVLLADGAPAHWRSYLGCKALWRAEQASCDVCPPGSRLGYRKAEEAECAAVLLDAYGARPAAAPPEPALDRLRRVAAAGLLDAFLLYEVAPRNVPGATLLVERPARLEVGRYVSDFVLVDVKR